MLARQDALSQWIAMAWDRFPDMSTIKNDWWQIRAGEQLRFGWGVSSGGDALGISYLFWNLSWNSRRQGGFRQQIHPGSAGETIRHEPRGRCGRPAAKRRFWPEQIGRNDHKEVGVCASTYKGPGGGLGGEGRIIESNIGSCVGQGRKCY